MNKGDLELLQTIADGALVGLTCLTLGLGVLTWYQARPKRSRLARRLRALSRSDRLSAIRQILTEHAHE